MKADDSRPIPRKHTETLVLLSVVKTIIRLLRSLLFKTISKNARMKQRLPSQFAWVQLKFDTVADKNILDKLVRYAIRGPLLISYVSCKELHKRLVGQYFWETRLKPLQYAVRYRGWHILVAPLLKSKATAQMVMFFYEETVHNPSTTHHCATLLLRKSRCCHACIHSPLVGFPSHHHKSNT